MSQYGYASLDVPETSRGAFVNRPTKGKTARKRKFPPKGTKTNVGCTMHCCTKGK